MDTLTQRPEAAPRLGLRERKKRLSRQTIADAALELTLEHGLEHVRIDDIAERAFVSPRTVSNYFRSKEAAVVAAGNDFEGLLDNARDLPAELSPIAVIRHLIVEAIDQSGDERGEALRRKQDLIMANEALVPQRLAQLEDLEHALRGILAERAGVDADTDAATGLLAGIAAAAVKDAVRRWMRSDGDQHLLASMLRESLDRVERGLGGA